MSKSNYQIGIDGTASDKPAEVTQIPAGKTAAVRLRAQPGGTYTLTDRATDKAPQQIHARRLGKDLLLQFDERGDGETDLILENFYGSAPGTFVGLAEDGSTYRFIPNTARESDQFASLIDGAQASQVLGGAAFGGADASVAVAGGVATGAVAAPLVAGGLAVGGTALAAGAVLLGAAALGSGGSSGAQGGGTAPNRNFSAALAPADDTGVSRTDGITNNPKPRVQGVAPVGARIQIRLDNGELVDAPVDAATGAWHWVPPDNLSEGPHTLTVISLDANNVATTQTLPLTVDTTKLTATLSSDFSTLNTEPTGAPDTRLNTNESKNGVLMTVKLAEKPGRDLTASDLRLSGGSIKAGSFSKVSDTEYQLTATPTADSTGDLLLQWSVAGQALTDVAGNALDRGLSQQLSIAYDTHAPAVTLSAGNTPIAVTSGQNPAISWATSETDIGAIKVSLLGQELAKTGSLSSPLTLAAADGLDKLVEGYYTLGTSFTDTSGNTSMQTAVLALNRNTLPGDAWVAANGNQQTGTPGNNLFINRAGSQSFKLNANGGADTIVWLKRDAGTPGSPDVDTVADFKLGSDGQADVLDIKDLLGSGANVKYDKLPKYVQVSTVDTNADTIPDSTRVSISALGSFDAGGTNVNTVADQVIVLQNVTGLANAYSLLPNLKWEAAQNALVLL